MQGTEIVLRAQGFKEGRAPCPQKLQLRIPGSGARGSERLFHALGLDLLLERLNQFFWFSWIYLYINKHVHIFEFEFVWTYAHTCTKSVCVYIYTCIYIYIHYTYQHMCSHVCTG